MFYINSKDNYNQNLDDTHGHLIEILKLIKTNYREDLITPNLHLSLHLNKCCKNYGPLYSFWSFSFERMNGDINVIRKKVSEWKKWVKQTYMQAIISIESIKI